MELTLSIYNSETLNKCKSLIDCAVLMTPNYAYVYEDDFNIDAAIKICEENNITPIIAIQRIFMEDELEEIKSFIIKYSNYKFIISDLGVAEIFIEMGLINNVIYDSPMMVCNSLDFSIYKSYGFDSISMSSEIPLEDIKTSYKVNKSNMFYHVFGRKMMFYSKRKLLSLYEEYSKVYFSKENLSLVEEKRNYKIPVFENKNGIYIFRQYHISLLKELDNLSFLKYAYFESLTLDDETIYNVLYIYQRYINNTITLDEALTSINILNLDIEDGFAYLDTVHTKEKIIS